jgi:hypothetical protein
MFPASVLLSSSLRRTLVLSVLYSAFATILTLLKNSFSVISLQRVSPIAIHIEPFQGSEYIRRFHFFGLHPGLFIFYPFGVSTLPFKNSSNNNSASSNKLALCRSKAPLAEGFGEALLLQQQQHRRRNNHIH